MATYTAAQLGLSGNFDNLGWYKGRQYDATTQTFSEPGQIHPNSPQQGAGKQVSNDVVSQSGSNNLSYIDSQIKANQLQAPTSIPLTTNATSSYVSGLNEQVEKAKKALQQNLATQQAETQSKLQALRDQEAQTVEKIGAISQPFREDLEKTERERLSVNKNFEENQKLVDELDNLLTEGNNLIKQQQEVTGLAAVRNPRIQKTMNDVAARVGVIEAVMNARNGQIGMAFQMIDRSVNAITQDRNDQLNYYNTILQLSNRDILLLDADSKRIAEEQTNILKTDLSRAQDTVAYIKELMVNPATATLLGQAGVSLNDSVETISAKLSQAQYVREISKMNNAMAIDGYTPIYDPSKVSASNLVTLTDSQGKKYYYKKPAVTLTPQKEAETWNPSGSGQTDVVPTQNSVTTNMNQYPVNLTSQLWNIVDTMTSSQSSSATLRP